MECQLDQALQGTLAVLTKVEPKDLHAPTPCASWDVRALVNHFVGTVRLPFGEFPGAVPAGAGPADQLAAYLGRVV